MIERMSNHQKDQLLKVLMHYMGSDLRQRAMEECPLAYNAAVGFDVVEVRHVSDGRAVRDPAPVVALAVRAVEVSTR